MTADDVLAFLDLMDAHGVTVWLDGGWAVDACLGEQTRRHADYRGFTGMDREPRRPPPDRAL